MEFCSWEEPFDEPVVGASFAPQEAKVKARIQGISTFNVVFFISKNHPFIIVNNIFYLILPWTTYMHNNKRESGSVEGLVQYTYKEE